MSSTESSISNVSDDELYKSDDFSAMEVEEDAGTQATAGGADGPSRVVSPWNGTPLIKLQLYGKLQMFKS